MSYNIEWINVQRYRAALQEMWTAENWGRKDDYRKWQRVARQLEGELTTDEIDAALRGDPRGRPNADS